MKKLILTLFAGLSFSTAYGRNCTQEIALHLYSKYDKVVHGPTTRTTTKLNDLNIVLPAQLDIGENYSVSFIIKETIRNTGGRAEWYEMKNEHHYDAFVKVDPNSCKILEFLIGRG